MSAILTATGKRREIGAYEDSGAVGDIYACNGRLTLATATPVTTADVTAATTLYFTPFKGDKVVLYDTEASAWDDPVSFTERSLDISGYTASTPYDIFLYDNSGTLTLAGVAWTNDTTRATALTTQNGVYVKSGAVNYRYLGTIRITATTGQCEDSTSRRFVWNYYNRMERVLSAIDTTDTWNYTTASWRAANNSTTDGVGRVALVVGVAEDQCAFNALSMGKNDGEVLAVWTGIGVDSTSVNSSQISYGRAQAAASNGLGVSFYRGYLAVGYHYIQRLERSSTVNGTTTWMGDGGNAGNTAQSGLVGNMPA